MPFASIPEAIEEIRAGTCSSWSTTKTAKTKATSPSPPKNHPRNHQLHGHSRPRPDLPHPYRRTLRRPPPAPHVARTTPPTSAPHSANPSTPATASPPASPPPTAPAPSSPPSAPIRRPADLARPGHIFPLRAREGGVLVRGGQTEASVDLARLAGLDPSGVICEIMNDDGTMARVPSSSTSATATGSK